MVALTYHTGERGYPGYVWGYPASNGTTYQSVIPAYVPTNSAGVEIGGGSSSAPSFTQPVGSANLAFGQNPTSVSPAAALLIVAARAGRQSVTITNDTGTQDVFFVATALTTGLATGFMLAGVKGASVTFPTAAAIYATSPTTAQTLSYVENY